jgi:uncharacterized repeat protein (TIGR03803 family)
MGPGVRGQTFEMLYSFRGAEDGQGPRARLVLADDGSFYGTTQSGSIFRISPAGQLITVANVGWAEDDEDEAIVTPRVTQGNDGSVYGTTFDGDRGRVFKMLPNGTLTTLVTFEGSKATAASPLSQLLQGRDGSFYGTTYRGGVNSAGSVFKMASDGTLAVLASFVSRGPTGQMIQARDGNFYGTTGSMAPNTDGFVFRVTPAGVLTYLAAINLSNADGRPWSGVIEARDGNFYGTTVNISDDGIPRAGGVFRMTPAGTVTRLVSFTGPNGSGPAELLEGKDGNLYGTTRHGGANGRGTVFKVTTKGILTTLFSFSQSDGAYPDAGLIEGADGNLYGTTGFGGAFGSPIGGYGTVFRIVMPSLSITNVGDAFTVSWPTNVVGLRLQSTLRLSALGTWMDVSNLPIVKGSNFVVTNAVSESSQFFRLVK